MAISCECNIVSRMGALVNELRLTCCYLEDAVFFHKKTTKQNPHLKCTTVNVTISIVPLEVKTYFM